MMRVGIFGGPSVSSSSLMASLLHMGMTQADTAPRGIRYTYKDQDGEFSRYYAEDSVNNRVKFIESLQNTEFNYQESDIQKFMAYSLQFAIAVEEI